MNYKNKARGEERFHQRHLQSRLRILLEPCGRPKPRTTHVENEAPPAGGTFIGSLLTRHMPLGRVQISAAIFPCLPSSAFIPSSTFCMLKSERIVKRGREDTNYLRKERKEVSFTVVFGKKRRGEKCSSL